MSTVSSVTNATQAAAAVTTPTAPVNQNTAPVVTRDTLTSSNPAPQEAPARPSTLKEKVSNGISYLVAIPVVLSLMPLMLVTRLLFACSKPKHAYDSPEALRLRTEADEKSNKKNIMSNVQKRIKQKMNSLDAAGRAQYKLALRNSDPSVVTFFARAYAAGIVGSGEWKKEPGIFNAAGRIFIDALASIARIEMIHIPFPAISQTYHPELLALQRRFDSLPKADQKLYIASMFKDEAPTSEAARALWTDARALGDRILQGMPQDKYRAHMQEAVQQYLTQNP